MDQWDEDRQNWTEPDLPEGPPPGTKTARVAVVAAFAVVLGVAAGVGIWAWAPDGEPSASGTGPTPQTVPSASNGAQAGPGKPAGSGGFPSDPCTAVSDELVQEWGLRVRESEEDSCRWHSAQKQKSLRLSFKGGAPQWPGATAIEIDGVSSAKLYKNAMTCMIGWSTPHGAVNLSASTGIGNSEDLCEVAADFAEAVASNLPS
ncbi:DUF3558 family protein [Streptomyces anulatus]|uniref:DUF3558 family protein n=1 Tax=Streptomyces anulatus TaxID=1892 RepID=UPI00369A42CE